MNDKIQRCHEISMRSVLESYGATFDRNNMFQCPQLWGNEVTNSGKIYIKNGIEMAKHWKSGFVGDVIEVTQLAEGVNKAKAISILLGEDQHIKREKPVFSPIDKAELAARELREKQQKLDQDKKLLYAIEKNSVPLIQSNIGCSYFLNRHISTAALTLNDPRINILVNGYKDKEGKNQSQIIYHCKGNGKNSERFAIVKGIDEDGNKTGYKRNIGSTRPVFHQGKVRDKFVIVEGLEDGLSAKEMAMSNNFISLNSTSNARKLIDTIDYCSKFYKNNSFSLALDNDEAGIKATKEIYDAFKGKGIDIEINEYHNIMKELNINDLNDLLIKEYIDPVDRLMDWSKGSREMER
jgi:5S rRNA maturation endonuclease (ribonuclease M5)